MPLMSVLKGRRVKRSCMRSSCVCRTDTTRCLAQMRHSRKANVSDSRLRALLADTPVLILDEATTFADPESEYLVQRALNRLTAGRTVLVIAHRLLTIVGADQIVVLQQGQIAEQGRHDELLAAQGEYAKLWAAATEHAVTVSGAER